MSKLYFVCSPYRAETHKEVNTNVLVAQSICRYVIKNLNGTPFAPHLLYTQFLDDSIEDDRNQGIRCGLDILAKCDYMIVLKDRITSGMQHEIDAANKMGVWISFVTLQMLKEDVGLERYK